MSTGISTLYIYGPTERQMAVKSGGGEGQKHTNSHKNNHCYLYQSVQETFAEVSSSMAHLSQPTPPSQQPRTSPCPPPTKSVHHTHTHPHTYVHTYLVGCGTEKAEGTSRLLLYRSWHPSIALQRCWEEPWDKLPPLGTFHVHSPFTPQCMTLHPKQR